MDWTAGLRSPTEIGDFSSSLRVQTGSGAHPASYTISTGALSPGVKRGPGVMLTTHPLLVPRSRKSRSCTSSHPNAPLWSVTGPLYLCTHITKYFWAVCGVTTQRFGDIFCLHHQDWWLKQLQSLERWIETTYLRQWSSEKTSLSHSESFKSSCIHT
jgi:hypothetical protein